MILIYPYIKFQITATESVFEMWFSNFKYFEYNTIFYFNGTLQYTAVILVLIMVLKARITEL